LDYSALFDGSTSNGRNLSDKVRLFIRPDDRSRMTGDCYVRFCEGLGVEFPPGYSTIKYFRSALFHLQQGQ